MSSAQNKQRDPSTDGTILMVEDDSDMLDTFRLWVADREFTLRTAQSGREAVDEFSADVDAVILDRQLPDFGGAEILQRIDHAAVPVAVISAYKPDQYLETEDVTMYLTKPVSKSDVIDAIETLLSE